MAGTPRKTASAGVDRNGAVVGMSGQGERPPRKDAGNVSESAYVRKPSGVSPTNLPHRKTDDGSSPSA